MMANARAAMASGAARTQRAMAIAVAAAQIAFSWMDARVT
jgi:hypothetical protein